MNIEHVWHNIIEDRLPRFVRRFYPGSMTRPMIKFLMDQFNGNPVVGCEIGVFEGDNALNMLLKLNIEKLYLVDPVVKWKKHIGDFSSKVVAVPQRSESAVDIFPDCSLDFVYIDGDHSYNMVKRDIELYWSKVRLNGVIGGHDFSADHMDVVRAVLEFESVNDIRVHGSGLDWWVVKE